MNQKSVIVLRRTTILVTTLNLLQDIYMRTSVDKHTGTTEQTRLGRSTSQSRLESKQDRQVKADVVYQKTDLHREAWPHAAPINFNARRL